MINWDVINIKIDNEEWAKEFINKTKKDLDYFIENYNDDASRIAGWFHHYNCPKCITRLAFDIDKPHEHYCKSCDEYQTGEVLDKVWNNMYRGKANSNVYSSAIMYKLTKDEKYLTYIKKVLDLYSNHYDEFICEPPAKAFEGKLMNQHLDDASSIILILLGMSIIKNEFTKEELKFYYENMFKHEAEMFDFFGNRIYNIPVWVKAAQAIIGVFFNEEEHIKRGIYSRFGILDQMKRGVTVDGMWYEASMHYHFYTIMPILYLMFVIKNDGFEIPEKKYMYDTVESMLIYPLTMMFDDRSLPNPNDAHPSISIDSYRTQYEYGSILFDNPKIDEICSTFYSKESSVSTFTRLLFNNFDQKEKFTGFDSVSNEESYTAMLRDEKAEVFVKYGIHTYLHAHFDTINIEMAFDSDVVSADTGNGGYGSWLFAEWQRKTIAHNTIAVDGTNQRNLAEGILVDYNKEEKHIIVKSKKIYQAIDYTRDVQIIDNVIYDKYKAEGRGDYTYDWFYYCKGDVKVPYETIEVDSVGDKDGYEHLMDIRSFNTDDDWYVDFELEDKTINVSMKACTGTTVYIFKAYKSSITDTRYGIMVRRKKETTVYDTTYKSIKK